MDLRYADRFDAFFKELWIHDNPTPKRGHYIILSLNFSGIQTQTLQEANEGFTIEIRNSLASFMRRYPESFPEHLHIAEQIQALQKPSDMINQMIRWLRDQESFRPVYVLIDEYDHFANNLLSQEKEDFLDLVKTDGYVRPFYEALKKATETNGYRPHLHHRCAPYPSLLFYMGYLTILEKKEESILLRVPNLVMKKMYWEYLYVIQRLAMGKKAERTGVDDGCEVSKKEVDPEKRIKIWLSTVFVAE